MLREASENSSHDHDEYSNPKLNTLLILGYIEIVLFGINLSFLAFNVFRYLIPLKVKSPLLILFYILSGTMTIARIIELIYLLLSIYTDM